MSADGFSPAAEFFAAGSAAIHPSKKMQHHCCTLLVRWDSIQK
jgi:hypothetical protein